jgi:S1-C subfamily serine protease
VPARDRRWPIAFLLIGALIGGLIGGLAGGRLVELTQTATSTIIPGSSQAAETTPAPSSSSGSAVAGPAGSTINATAIYKQASPGVVTISSTLGSTFRSFGEATGTGIILDTQGDILTNEHVVANARQTRVTFSDGSTVNGTVAGTDASDDLAIVKVSVSTSRLHPLTLADSSVVQVGDPVVAIGTPFGLSESLTAGIVSGLNRSSQAPNGRQLTGLIQTDAAINPGNSGGPLLNAQGQVIGVDESIQSPIQGNVGVGFAVPSNTAKRVLKQLEQGQTVQRPWLGISGESITPAIAQSAGLSRDSGVIVVDVVPGAPAQQAGLRGSGNPDPSDDIIIAIDGHPTNTIDQLTAYLDTKNVGDKVTLTVVRGGKTIQVQVTLGPFQSQTGG